jgi:hypothetical protein
MATTRHESICRLGAQLEQVVTAKSSTRPSRSSTAGSHRESTSGAPSLIFPTTCSPHEQSKSGALVVDSLDVEAAGANWRCFGVHLDEPHTRRPSPSPEMHQSATTACMPSRAQAAVLLQIRVIPFFPNAGEHLPVIPSLSSLRFASHPCP